MSEARKTPQSHFTGPVVIDPLTRIEGHLRIEVEVKDGRVSEARSVGTLYRGLETILVGRDPRDVQHFTQRTCGVCTYTHALASTRALEDAIKVEIPKNATYIRNLVLGMQYLHDHIVHFYHLHALDFVDVTSALQADPVKAAKICSSVSPRPASADDFKAVQAKLKAFVESGQLGPFTNAYFLGGHPAYYLDPEANLIATAHYLEALRLQVKAARAMAVFGAKNPHTQFLVAGGVTCYESLTPERIAGMAKGVAWFKVPAAIKVELTGAIQRPVTGKDVILHLIGEIGVSGALYKSLEFVGEGVKSLTMEDRLCICNMAIEAGAKNGIFPVDEITEAYLKGRSQRPWVKYEADPDAEYERTVTIDLTTLEPTVSYPHLPENTHLAKEGKDIKIDQIVIGSCTNGRIEDMQAAYEVLKGKHIAKGVRGIIIPATMAVYKECILRGYTEAFIDAGCIVSTPTCGPCLGGYMGILAAGERCVSTTNRNFVGRMGHVDSEVYLASPATAAASALTGYITDPREV